MTRLGLKWTTISQHLQSVACCLHTRCRRPEAMHLVHKLTLYIQKILFESVVSTHDLCFINFEGLRRTKRDALMLLLEKMNVMISICCKRRSDSTNRETCNVCTHNAHQHYLYVCFIYTPMYVCSCKRCCSFSVLLLKALRNVTSGAKHHWIDISYLCILIF